MFPNGKLSQIAVASNRANADNIKNRGNVCQLAKKQTDGIRVQKDHLPANKKQFKSDKPHTHPVLKRKQLWTIN